VVLIGGAAKLAEGGSLEVIVRDGVLAPANEVGAAVVDGGTDAGVMALAGHARRALKTDIPLIGVAPVTRIRAAAVEAARGETALEPNHSHVILAPGDEWGAELPWMLEAAHVISAGKPVVAVLVDGGPLALTEATRCLAQGWPLITIAGSGRAADDVVALSKGGIDAPGSAGSSAIHVVDLAGGAAPVATLLKRLLNQPPTPAGTSLPAPTNIEYPALYTVASEASKRGQRLYKWLAFAELFLTIAGLAVAAAIGLAVALGWLAEEPVLPPGIPEPPPFTGNGVESLVVLALAGAFLAAFVIKFIARSASYDDDWFTGRAVAETAKSEAWRFMMRVPPYAGDNGEQEFSADLSDLARRASLIRQAVDRLPSRPRQISASMRAVREMDLVGRRNTYVTGRLVNQAEWYGRRSARHRRWASRWFWASVLLQLGAAGLALFALYDAGHTPLLLRFMGLFASVAIFFTAWSQLNRDDELAKSYASALHELLLLADTATSVKTEEQLSNLVDRGEEAVGRENKVWVAKRTERVESPEFGRD